MARMSIGSRVGVGVGVIVGEGVGVGVALAVALGDGVAVRVAVVVELGCRVIAGDSPAGLRAEQAASSGKARQKTIKSHRLIRGIFMGDYLQNVSV